MNFEGQLFVGLYLGLKTFLGRQEFLGSVCDSNFCSELLVGIVCLRAVTANCNLFN